MTLRSDAFSHIPPKFENSAGNQAENTAVVVVVVIFSFW